MTQLRSTDLKRLHRSWRQRTEHRLAIGLDDVFGPHNVGSIIRTAAAYRATTMWVTERGTGPDHAKVGQTALGCERYLDMRTAPTGVAIVEQAKAAGFTVLAVELTDDAVPLHEMALDRDVCLVVGNEDHGIHRDAVAAADAVAFLPQLGRVGSLNVATAASLAMYEWARQQWTANP